MKLGGQPPPANVLWRKHLALLVYLALSPERTRARDHLLGLLWPEKPQQQARHSLNEAVRRLRTSLGPERLMSRGETLTLSDVALTVDALAFQASVAARPGEAAALLRGDFLEGLHLDDAPAFEEWAAREAGGFRARGAAVLVAAGDDALAGGEPGEAEECARRALALDVHGEPGVRLLMRARAVRGDVSGALAAFHDFTAQLAADLDEQPSSELAALADRVRSRRWRRGGGVSLAARPEEEMPSPLVGRETEHREAFSIVAEGLRTGPRVLVITGDPGTGRSRLLAECLDRVALEGSGVALATPLESDSDAPWSTLRSLARGGLADAPGVIAADPEALGLLAALVPEWGARARGGGALRGQPDHAEVGGALARVLRAVADERPFALAVDDAHWADGASLAALGAALGELAGTPVVLLLCTLHEVERLPRELVRLRGEVGRRLPGATVRLGPLGDVELRRLVEALAPWAPEPEKQDRLARRLALETGGNPFLAVTLLRGLEEASTLRGDVLHWPPRGGTTESPLPISVPNLVRMAIVARVSTLGEADRQVIRAASVAGLALEPELLAALVERPVAAIEESLTRLERDRLVEFDGRRFVFPARLVAEVVQSECLTPGQRELLRKRAAVELARRSDLESRVLRAEILAQVAPSRGAYEDAVAAAQDALTAGAERSARRSLAAAQRALGDTPSPDPATLEDLRRRSRGGGGRGGDKQNDGAGD